MKAAEPIQARMIYRDAVSPTENTEPATRPARRRLAPDDRRQALINSALKLFNTHLYDEVSVDDIAAEAGMDDPDNWLAAGLGAFFDHIQANPIGLTALLQHGSLTGREDWQVLDEISNRVLRLILAALDPPGDSPVLKSVLRGWIAMVETMGRGWLRHGQPTRQELETLLPELLRAVLGAAAWHDAATAAVLPRLPRGRAT